MALTASPCACEMIAAHSCSALRWPSTRLDRGVAAHLALDGRCDAVLLPGGEGPELVAGALVFSMWG